MRFVISCKIKNLKEAITNAWRIVKYQQNGKGDSTWLN